MSCISVIIPALNEKDGIEKTINDIPRAAIEKAGYNLQIIVVDGGSKDGTPELAKKAGAEVVIDLRRGYGRAYKTGFAIAKGDIIVTSDADGTYPVEEIPKLVQILENENLDFITTNRFALMDKKTMSFRNRLGNVILSSTMMILFRLKIKDSQSGMWVFRSYILNSLVLKSNTPLSQEIKIEACHFGGYAWKEVPIQYRQRMGHVKLGGWKVGLVNLTNMFKKRIVR